MIPPQSCMALAPPGCGKSTLAGSICDVVGAENTLLLVAKPGEESSAEYLKHGLSERAELFFDRDWVPTLRRYDAGAYVALLTRLDGLLDDEDFDAVIIDPGTDVIGLIEHHLLAPHNVGSVGDLGDGRSFYRQLADTAEEFVKSASILSTMIAARPKWVIIPWHTQPVKEGELQSVGGGQKQKERSADEKARGVEYEGNVLPMIEGKYRRKIAGDMSMVLYCDIETSKDRRTKEERVEYVVQAYANADKHAKIRSAPALQGWRGPNNFTALIAAMEEAQSADPSS